MVLDLKRSFRQIKNKPYVTNCLVFKKGLMFDIAIKVKTKNHLFLILTFAFHNKSIVILICRLTDTWMLSR